MSKFVDVDKDGVDDNQDVEQVKKKGLATLVQ